MGKKDQTATSSQTQTYTPSGASQLQDIWNKIQGVTSQGYQPYSGQIAAGLDPTQQAGINTINNAVGTAQPYFDKAAQYGAAGAAPISASDIQRYQSPYTQQVIDATQRQFADNNAQQQQQVIGNAALQGALGGDRVGVAQAELARQQKLAQDPTIAGLYNQGYTQALGAAQADRAAQAQGAYTFGALAPSVQNTALQGGQSQLGAGAVAQGTQQNALTANYQQYLQQQAYPYQQAQFLAQYGLPTITAMGGTQSGQGTQTTPGPSPWGQLLGLGTAAVSAFSDKRVKDNIEKVGKTFDGQNIYSYNYKGDNTPQMGLMAQEVEKKTPEAVGEVSGIKTVNYKKATAKSAKKGRFARGGAVDYSDIPSYIPSYGVGIPDLTPKMTPMQMPSTGSQQASYMPSASDLKGMAGGMKSIANMFNGDGGVSLGTEGGTGLAGFGGLYADGGAVTPFDLRWGGGNAPSDIGGTSLGTVPADVSLARSDWNAPIPLSAPVTGTAPIPANVPVTQATPTSGYADNLGRFGNAISGIESGGKYDTLGPVIDKTGDRAYGKYQVMGANIPEWTKEILGKPMTPQEFLANPQAQDAMFKGKFGQYANKYGPEGAARAWFAGEGGMNNPMARDQLGTTVADYSSKFLNNLGAPGGQPMQTADDGNIPPNATLTQATPQSTSSMGGWNPLNLSDTARQALMSAGLGMMASKSPFALTQIGEGGLQGMQAYQTIKQQAADRAMKARQLDMQAQQMAQRADQFAQEFGLKKQQYSLQTMQPVKVGTDMMGRDIYAQRDPKTGQYINLQTGKPISESPQGSPFITPPPTGVSGAPGTTTSPAAATPPNVANPPPEDASLPSGARPTMSENPNVHPDFLATLNPQIAAQVKALSEGRMQFPSGFALKSPYWQSMLQMVSMYDPSFDAVNYNARSKTRNDFTSGKSAQNITSFNTAIGHLDTLDKSVDALGNTRFPSWNKIANAAAGEYDTKFQSSMKQFQASKNAVVDELTRAFRGTGGNVHDIVEWEKTINSADSPQALHAATRAAIELLRSRIEAVGDQYNRGMGTTKDPIQMLSPKAQAAINRIEGGHQSSGSAAVPALADREKGKIYTTPKGNFRWNGAGWEKP